MSKESSWSLDGSFVLSLVEQIILRELFGYGLTINDYFHAGDWQEVKRIIHRIKCFVSMVMKGILRTIPI